MLSESNRDNAKSHYVQRNLFRPSGSRLLLGVIALSGSLVGVPLSWLRLSVVGALQYELNVAEIAATGMGLSGLKVSELSIAAFTTISLVMTGTLSGITCCIFGLKKYLRAFQEKKEQTTASYPGFEPIANTPCSSDFAAHTSVPMWEPGQRLKTVRLFL